MEALVLIFGELIFAILAPFVMLIVELIGSVLSLIFSFGAGRKPSRVGTSRAGTGRAGTSRAARVIAMILFGLAILALTAIGVANSFYFEKSVRYGSEESSGLLEHRSWL